MRQRSNARPSSPPGAAASPGEPGTKRSREKPTILIVDDSRDLRTSLADLLEEEGYQTACCEDGKSALAYLRNTEPPPSLILLDLMMPGMNGWQFRDQQLEDDSLRSIPVVGMTANRGAPPLRDVSKVIMKPFVIDELLQAIEQCRSRRDPSASSPPKVEPTSH